MEIAPKKGRAHLWTILEEIWDYSPSRHHATRIIPALEQLRKRLSRMSIVILISDFFFQENMFEEIVFKQIGALTTEIIEQEIFPRLQNAGSQ